jgi:hypothetical protein
MSDRIWNTDDPRPDWVKSILRGGHRVLATQDGDRWYFSPIGKWADYPIGYALNATKETGETIPSIWDGKKWLDMRTDEGAKLYYETKSPNAPDLVR